MAFLRDPGFARLFAQRPAEPAQVLAIKILGVPSLVSKMNFTRR
jgi:hypothetical protein